MLLAAAAAFAGAVVQSATGFGFALVLSPALLAVFDPYEAVSAVLVLGFVLNLLVLFEMGRLGPVRGDALAPLLLAALPGLPLGVLVLELMSKPLLQLLVGAVVVAGASHRLVRRPEGPPEAPAGASGAAVAGLLSGALTTSITISGPPLVLWLERRALAAAELRATLAAAFLALNLCGAAALLLARGAGRWAPGESLAVLLGLVLVGHYAGQRVFRRLDEDRFASVVLVLVAVTGLASLVAGAVAL